MLDPVHPPIRQPTPVDVFFCTSYSLLKESGGNLDGFLVAAYHHSGITVVSPQHHSGAVLSVPARQNLFKYKNNSAVKISLSTKNIDVMPS